MDQIIRAIQALKQAELDLDEAVAAEREYGKSWADIGQSLGISRQAAFKRFGKITDPRTGEKIMARNVEHLMEKSKLLINRIASGEEELVMGMIHPDAREELNWNIISETWRDVLESGGTLESMEDSFITIPRGAKDVDDKVPDETVTKLLGTAVVVSTIKQEAGETISRVAFDNKDLVIGILLLDPAAPQEMIIF